MTLALRIETFLRQFWRSMLVATFMACAYWFWFRFIAAPSPFAASISDVWYWSAAGAFIVQTTYYWWVFYPVTVKDGEAPAEDVFSEKAKR